MDLTFLTVNGSILFFCVQCDSLVPVKMSPQSFPSPLKDQSREGAYSSGGREKVGESSAACGGPTEAGGKRAVDSGAIEAGGRGQSYGAAEEEETGKGESSCKVINGD